MAIAKVRRVDGYGNNSRQQLEDNYNTITIFPSTCSNTEF